MESDATQLDLRAFVPRVSIDVFFRKRGANTVSTARGARYLCVSRIFFLSVSSRLSKVSPLCVAEPQTHVVGRADARRRRRRSTRLVRLVPRRALRALPTPLASTRRRVAAEPRLRVDGLGAARETQTPFLLRLVRNQRAVARRTNPRLLLFADLVVARERERETAPPRHFCENENPGAADRVARRARVRRVRATLAASGRRLRRRRRRRRSARALSPSSSIVISFSLSLSLSRLLSLSRARRMKETIPPNPRGAAARSCPSCSLRVQRTEGCNHIACPNCSTHWCFVCEVRWTNQHYACRDARGNAHQPPPQGTQCLLQ